MRKTTTWMQRALHSTWAPLVAVVLLTGGLLTSLPVPWQKMAVLAWHTVVTRGVTGLFAIFGTILLLAIVTARVVAHSRNRDRAIDRRVRVRPIPMWAIWLGLAVVLVVGGASAWVLVSAFGSGSPQDKIRLEAVKLAGTIAVGTGGTAALLLTARRQRTTEVDLLQKGHDADERRVTELYTAAAQQLGSDKAPVRLAGLYALSRLGQASPDHRQTIVNLFCAYLRMPDISCVPSESEYATSERKEVERNQREENPELLTLDLTPALAEAIGLSLDGGEQRKQERQVRLTAQRLLTQHLKPEPDSQGRPTNPDYWPGRDASGFDLDLTNASLHDWNFYGCETHSADFTGAHFHGDTLFSKARFTGLADFRNTHFHGRAKFGFMHFHGIAQFHEAEFHHVATFSESHFAQSAQFQGTYFYRSAHFNGVNVYGSTQFDRARFHDATVFSEAVFDGATRFAETRFHSVRFNKAHFKMGAQFGGAQFQDIAEFNDVNFHRNVRFDGAQFHKPPMLMLAWARIDHGSSFDSTWPRGFTTYEADPGDGRAGRWGLLAPETTKAEASEPPSRPDSGENDIHK